MFKFSRHPAAPPSYAVCFDPATIAIVAVAGQAAFTLAGGAAEKQAAQARQQALEHQAKQARQNAGQERAASQRAAFDQRRQARFASSTAQARAAASGAGVGDPTAVNILGDIAAEGEFRALNELFIGEERARSLETQADALVFEGNQESIAGGVAQRLSILKAATGVAQAKVDFDAARSFGSSPAPTTLSTTGSAGVGLSRFGLR